MDISKFCKGNQTGINKLQKCFQEEPDYGHKHNIPLPERKQWRENLKLNCLACGVLLTSELQAHEHFLGKKHQNMIKNMANFNSSQSRSSLLSHLSMHNNSIIIKGNFNKFHISGNYTWNRKSDVENNSNEVIPPPAGRDNILETVIKSEKRNISSSDLSIYRTPSGKYYCQSCNLTVNSQAQFIQHTESRKHKHRVTKTQCKLK